MVCKLAFLKDHDYFLFMKDCIIYKIWDLLFEVCELYYDDIKVTKVLQLCITITILI